MRIYLISQTENADFYACEGAVVCAPDAETARSLDPNTGKPITNAQWRLPLFYWCASAEQVTAKYIGEAEEGTEQGVVLASFNAG